MQAKVAKQNVFVWGESVATGMLVSILNQIGEASPGKESTPEKEDFAWDINCVAMRVSFDRGVNPSLVDFIASEKPGQDRKEAWKVVLDGLEVQARSTGFDLICNVFELAELEAERSQVEARALNIFTYPDGQGQALLNLVSYRGLVFIGDGHLKLLKKFLQERVQKKADLWNLASQEEKTKVWMKCEIKK